MDQDSWLSCEKMAVLQGGFLQATRLCQLESLSTLKKEGWGHIGNPIINAVTEICEHLVKVPKERLYWKKKILCIVWSKVLNVKNTEDIENAWKEDVLFGVLNSLPDINHTVLIELVKSMHFSSIYVELLLCLSSTEQCEELKMLVDHVTSSSTEEDVKLFLEVWWELQKGKRGCCDDLDQLFTARSSQSMLKAESSVQASKRFKSDPDSISTCKVHLLFEGLRKIKEHFTSSEMCFVALSNCLDTMHSNYLLSSAADLEIELKLQHMACIVNLKKGNKSLHDFDMPEVIRKAQRDLAAAFTPVKTKPSGMTFIQAMQVTLEVICCWEVMGFLKTFHNEPTITVVRLKDSVGRVLGSLEQQSHGKDLIGQGETLNSLRASLKGLMGSLEFKVPECSGAEMTTICTSILDNRLEGFEGLPALFATKLSLEYSEMEWINCLERNTSQFQTKDLLMSLISTLNEKCNSGTNVQHCKKLKDVIVDLFSHLSKADQNATLAELLQISSKGLHLFLPSSITKSFSEELNLAFNSIIQSGAKRSLDPAVAAVARVAFQNPEATLSRCCHMAVVNLGAHTLIAEILQQLPGLVSSFREHNDNLVCKCLQNTVWHKLSSPQEENQFVQFVAELMKCETTTSIGATHKFLLPEVVLHVFVQPYLLSTPSSNLEFCLRIFQCILSQEISTDSMHWIMSCSPLPIIYCLAQMLNECSRCWDQPIEGERILSIEVKDLLLSVMHEVVELVGKEVACAPDAWSRALFWLYNKVEEMDWTVRFCLKGVWGEHFKYEVPRALLSVCDLPEQDWSGLDLPEYGQGTGLVAWLECCALSGSVHKTLIEYLSLNLQIPNDINMFSKGLLVGVCQILPWSTSGEWEKVIDVIQELLQTGKLHVPYSLEYVDFLPLLDLRLFSCDLRLSVFLLRIFQLLCSSSCSDWLPSQGWLHAGRLYASTMRSIINSVKEKISLQSNTESSKTSGSCDQEVLFVLTQLYCHVLHVQVMIPGQPKALFLCALEILTHYEEVISAYPGSCNALQGLNTRHFFTTIADNLQCSEMKGVLHQKIAQL